VIWREVHDVGDSGGIPFMKFVLTFDGELRASANKSKPHDVWKIRKHFHPQLQELQRESRVLREAMATLIPESGPFFMAQSHHDDPSSQGRHTIARANNIKTPLRSLYEPMVLGTKRFQPIVRESMALTCSLDILFLRKEDPGSLVQQGGDLDGRLKTLFDAMSAPAQIEQLSSPECENIDDPTYCVMENDSLITGYSIKTGRLLNRPNASKHDVHLVIEVNVRVMRAMAYNQLFFSD
jgi:hypothetical protein